MPERTPGEQVTRCETIYAQLAKKLATIAVDENERNLRNGGRIPANTPPARPKVRGVVWRELIGLLAIVVNI